MKNEELIELIEDLQKALSKALNNEVIREYDHLQVRAEIAVKKLTIPVVSNSVICPNCGCNKIDEHNEWYTCLNRECDFGGKL